MTNGYDSVLVQSFGGPEGPDDVMDFLRNVTRGRNVPDERLAVVAEQYEIFGGVSPLNEFVRNFASELELALLNAGLQLPVFIGHRNWAPYISDTAKEMADLGHTKALVFTTSAFSSFSGCRQYRQDLAAATEAAAGRIEFRKLRLYFNHPKFVEGWVSNINAKLVDMKPAPYTLFTAHSIPESMAEVSEYVPQLNEIERLLSEETDIGDYELVFQSRSGPPHIPWLEPDVCDRIASLVETGKCKPGDEVLICPLGFTSDHMEVLYDLDTQAKQAAEKAGLGYKRVEAVGHNPKFIELAVELVKEVVEDLPRSAVGALPAWPDDCGGETHCIPQSMLR